MTDKKMKQNKHKRLRVLADFRLQGNLCLRIMIYWIVCQLSMIGTILAFSFLGGPASEVAAPISRFIVPPLVISSLVLPIALLDMLMFSNRFAGPLLNFRRKLGELVENGACEDVRFRGGDYYRDLGDNFNKLREKIQA